MALNKCDISFKNIYYNVQNPFLQNKIILNDVSGEFRSNELTAIIGTSGSGKSSLLNALSGYQTKDIKGSISINGVQNQNFIKRNSSYVMQEYTFHKFITVRETLMFRINCKISKQDESVKNEKIEMILNKIGLENKEHAFAGELSGGETKRLSIAVELISDPKIIFIDEPTTNLDSVTSTQCIQLLKNISNENRTIICSIHQPSALIFKMFNHIYALANGTCIYQGSSDNLVPFLNDLELICPPTYNPADFLLEIANDDYGQQHKNRLNAKVEIRSQRQAKVIDDEKSLINTIDNNFESNSLKYEITQLVKRNALNNTRDKTFTIMRLVIHLFLSLLIGFIYKGIGQESSNILNTYKFLFFNIFILMFTAFSSLQTTFPIEFPICKRETFNGSYTVVSYFIALTLSDMPITILSNLLYVFVAYFMTDQPNESFRLISYFIIILLTSFASQGLGLIAGSLLNVKFTLIFGSFLLCPFVMFSNFFIHMKDTHSMFHIFFNLSFTKYAFDGSMLAIFANRNKMKCEADYCHFRLPQKFLDFLQINDDFYSIIIKLLIFCIFFRIIAFAIMYMRLKRSC